MVARSIVALMIAAPAMASVCAAPPPPTNPAAGMPKLVPSVSVLRNGSWHQATSARLREKVRFQLLAQTTFRGKRIGHVDLIVMETHLDADGHYQAGATILRRRMRNAVTSGADTIYRTSLTLDDPSMVGQLSATFDVTYAQESIGPNLFLPVLPANRLGPDPTDAAYWGLDMTVSLPRESYPRDALVQATLRIRNNSTRSRTIQSGYCSRPPWIELLGPTGAVLPRLSFAGDGPPCPGMISVTIAPGQVVTQKQYVVVSSNRVRAAALFGDLTIHGPALTVRFTRGNPPAVHHQTTGGHIAIQLALGHSPSGSLHYGYRITCAIRPGASATLGSNTWRAALGQQIVAKRFDVCEPNAPWTYDTVAGWLGRAVARIHIVDRMPMPCNRGVAGRQPVFGAIPPAALAAIGIHLSAAGRSAAVCRAEARYTVVTNTVAGPIVGATLARVSSSTDSYVNARLAWVFVTRYPDPNHHARPPVLYLTFVGAQSGKILDIVYAGGRTPPTPPVHLRTVPRTAYDPLVLAASREKPPVSAAQARSAAVRMEHPDRFLETVLARNYTPNNPTLLGRLCWIFSVVPRGATSHFGRGEYWVIYVDANSGKVLMSGGTVPGGMGVP